MKYHYAQFRLYNACINMHLSTAPYWAHLVNTLVTKDILKPFHLESKQNTKRGQKETYVVHPILSIATSVSIPKFDKKHEVLLKPATNKTIVGGTEGLGSQS